MRQVHIGAYVSLLEPGKTDYTACHPRKTTTYILHVVPINTHTHDRRKSIGKEETKRRKEDKGKKRKDKKRQEKTRKDKKRQDKKRKQGKEERKNVILADPRN